MCICHHNMFLELCFSTLDIIHPKFDLLQLVKGQGSLNWGLRLREYKLGKYEGYFQIQIKHTSDILILLSCTTGEINCCLYNKPCHKVHTTILAIRLHLKNRAINILSSPLSKQILVLVLMLLEDVSNACPHGNNIQKHFVYRGRGGPLADRYWISHGTQESSHTSCSYQGWCYIVRLTWQYYTHE